MSTALRIVDIYLVGNQETDATGRPLAQPTRLTRCESVLLRVHLLNADGTPYTDLPATVAFQYGLDNSYVAGSADPVASSNDNFIPSDWPGVDGWDLTQGRLCVRVSLKSTQLGTACGTKPELSAVHAIWATPAGDEAFLLFSVPVWVDNVTVEPGNIVAPDVPDSYVTVDAARAAFIPQVGDQYAFKVVTISGAQYLAHYFSGDGIWRAQVPQIVAGQPTLGWVAL